MRRGIAARFALALAGAALLVAAVGARADTGTVSAEYQAYSAAGGQDPYASSNPQDIHVDGYGGQPVVTGYLKLNLESLPSGSTIDGLTLSLTPNGSAADNVSASSASIEACMLTAPLGGNGYQANPPSYDCALLHASGEVQANGDWHFEIAPLAQYWQRNQNTGLALVAYTPANAVNVPVDPTAWAIGFDHTRTKAAVDYSPGGPAAFTVPPPPAASSGGGGSSQLSPVGPVAGAGAAAVLPPVPSAPAGTPAAAPRATPTPATAGGAATSTPGATVVTSVPRASQRWVWLTVALAAGAVLMLVVGASQHLMRGGRLDLGAVGAALSASRSQLATPVATLAVASVFALGFSGQLVSSVHGGGGAGGGPAGSAATAQGGGAAASTPGATAGGPTGVPGTVAPGSSAAAGTTAGGAAAGGAAVAANGNTNGGANGPGVTATTVRIGFIYVSDTQTTNNALGLKVPNPGNEQSEEQALVDYVNKHGGLGGRQIQPVFVSASNAKSQTDPNIGTEICTTLTEDYHVFAVVAGGGPPDDANADACYAQHGTINLDGATSGASLQALRGWSPYIWVPEAVAQERQMQWEIAGLQSRGFFASTPGYKLGVLVADDAINHDIYNRITVPQLHAAGVSSIDPQWVPHDTLSDTANTIKQAVIHMQADGVTHVIFQGGGSDGDGSYAVLFLVDAESQHFNPRYGFSSEDAPVALVSNVPQDQFQDAKGEPALAVGTAPSTDTDDQHYAPWPSTPAEKTCANIENAAGNSFSSREGAIVIVSFCSDMFELQQGAQGLTTLNAQLWANNVMQLGGNVYNAYMYRGTVGPDHWDAAAGYRLLHAVQNCEGNSACFEYDNSNMYGG